MLGMHVFGPRYSLVLAFFLAALSGDMKVQELGKATVKECEANSYLVTCMCKQT